MKRSYNEVQKRRNEIMLLIQKKGEIDMETIAKMFNVSSITIRRDLQYWEDNGAIIRHYGGAKLVQHMVETNDIDYTNEKYIAAIAKHAASFIEDNDTIFINTSITALSIIKYITNKRCTIITNNIKAVNIKHNSLIQIVLTGGDVRYPKESLVGDIAVNTLNRIVANKCFLGCSGLSVTNGATTAIMSEVAINETMINRTSGEKFILCDHTKIGLTHSFISTPIQNINHIITDTDANVDILEQMQLKNPNMIIDKVKPIMKV